VARYNEILVGRWNRYIQKLTGIKGPPPAPQLSGDISFVHHIDSGVENRYIQQWNEFAGLFIQNGAGANQGFIRFQMLLGSNTIAVLERITLVNAVANAVADNPHGDVAGYNFVGTQVGGGNAIDQRSYQNQSIILGSQLQVWAGAGLNPGGSFRYGQWALPVNGNFEVIIKEDDEIPILPGSAFQFANSVANIQLTVAARWRERFLEDSERS
jgi:hypothetical protein